MERYMVISNHNDKGCTNALKSIEAAGFLTHFDWGCKDGVHTGWAIIEADSAKEAMMVVPSGERSMAQVVHLVKFGPTGPDKAHKA